MMKRRPKADITVRICSYNRSSYLREALVSVLKQNVIPETIEIFDNASKPEVYETIRDLIGKKISFNTLPENVGGILNIQRAFYGVKTKYLYIMHDDDRILPDFLSTQIAFLERNEGCVAVSCNSIYINEEGEPIAGQWLPTGPGDKIFSTQRELALFYAEAFLGFPGFVYRSEAIAPLKFRRELGKACDVGLILDLGESGSIGFQNKNLLEYRIHSNQDSLYFSERIIKSLFDFLSSFLTRNDPETRRFRKRYRIRLKNTFIANVRMGKSGWNEFFWLCSFADLELLFRIFAGFSRILLKKIRDFFSLSRTDSQAK
ncbi:MAG: glycosyltransferase family 2 protein [Turneriella sp.]